MIRPKDREIAETLRLIIQRHGKEMVYETARFCALMNDYIMSPELKHEKALLRRACIAGVFGMLADAMPDGMEFACKKGFYVLTANEFIADEWAKRVISWICFAFDEETSEGDAEQEEAREESAPIAITDEQSVMERLLDANNEENVVLLNGNGEETEFEKIATVEVDGSVYFVLRPLEEVPDVAPDEAMIFALTEQEREEFLSLVTDGAVIDQVFKKYTETRG